jgi:outer membrane protein
MGAPPDGVLPLPASGGGVGALEPLDTWLERATRDSPLVLLAQAREEVARQEARKTAGALSPTVDLVAQVGRERLSGSGDFGAASNLAMQRSVGVQLTLPLYTGGSRSAKHDEAAALVEKARADSELARQQARQQARSAWLDLSVGSSRIEALASGRRAGLARLDATRVGLEAGDRTTLDLLNAQNDAAAAELALLQARVRQLTQRLRLAAAAGALDESLLAAVQRELGAGEQPPARN